MKPNDYVRKYKLNESDKFYHNDFIADFTFDFISLVEWFKQKSAWQHPHFLECVKQTRSKWDSINNKTAGELPEKLWNYFYATVIVKSEEDLFPEIAEKKIEILRMNIEKLCQFLQDRGILVSDYQAYGMDRKWDQVDAKNNPILTFAFGVYERRIHKKMEQDEVERQKEAEKMWGEWQERRKKSADWFNFLFANIRMSNIPKAEFQLLGLTESATEDDIKTNYRKLSMVHHPDKGGSQEMFIKISDAKNKCMSYIQQKTR